MSDTAQEPALDLDAMLQDLHNEFQGDPPERDENFGLSKPYGGTEDLSTDGSDAGTADGTDSLLSGGGTDVGDGQPTGSGSDGEDQLDQIVPPGYVKVGDQVVSELEARAFLGLNERIKRDPEFAQRLQAVVDGKPLEQEKPAEEQLPAWLDPDDQQALFLYRSAEATRAEVAEMRRRDEVRQQQAQIEVREAREAQVKDAFREGMREFKDDHPQFDMADLNGIAQSAGTMGLLENPEAIGGTLKAGFIKALEGAMWASPEYREKAAAGATLPSKAERSTSRKQKSSALSSSTGSVVRTQSQEQTPTTRKDIMGQALEFLRSGAVTD